MKKAISILAVSALIGANAAQAASVDAYFDGASGKLVIPHLEVNGKVYYATLTLTDGATLTFTTDFSTLTNISPPESSVPVNTDPQAIVGKWTEEGSGESHVTFFSDGRYEQFQNPGDDPNCSAGGPETGIYSWEPSTGLLLVGVEIDENLSCGLSNPRDDVPLRIFVNGDSMQILEKGGQFNEEEFFMTRTGE